MAPKQLRVLVVDDSPTVRAVIARKLDESPQINVVGRAADGIEALELARSLEPDVITLDVEMPRLDGLQTLERLMAERPVPVVMVSSLTREGADATIRALELGAVDFIEKPVFAGVAAPHAIADALIDKVLVASKVRLRARRAPAALPSPARPGAAPKAAAPAPRGRRATGWLDRTVVIGCSTGGPQALQQVLTKLPGNFGVPIVVVQHMPPHFTRSLAERLDSLSEVEVREARPGSKLAAGLVLIAPGGFHMTVDSDGVCSLNEDEPECGVRPAVNVTLESIAATHGRRTVAAILTGMGSDGLRGVELVHKAGGHVLAEAEETCVVYGMPRSVIDAGFADLVVPLPDVANALVDACRPATLRKAG